MIIFSLYPGDPCLRRPRDGEFLFPAAGEIPLRQDDRHIVIIGPIRRPEPGRQEPREPPARVVGEVALPRLHAGQVLIYHVHLDREGPG